MKQIVISLLDQDAEKLDSDLRASGTGYLAVIERNGKCAWRIEPERVVIKPKSEMERT